VRNTLRHNMLRLLSGELFFPRSWLVRTDRPTVSGLGRVWVKRGEYHATVREDVVLAEGRDELRRALRALSERGVSTALVQSHVDGDLVKFYGVIEQGRGSSRWFCWFYHREQARRGHPFDPLLLREISESAASLLGLEVYGGDAIISPGGGISIIDVNAWPSFALYRDVAADHISDLIADRMPKGETP
jgi:hypothetical protein